MLADHQHNCIFWIWACSENHKSRTDAWYSAWNCHVNLPWTAYQLFNLHKTIKFYVNFIKLINELALVYKDINNLLGKRWYPAMPEYIKNTHWVIMGTQCVFSMPEYIKNTHWVPIIFVGHLNLKGFQTM